MKKRILEILAYVMVMCFVLQQPLAVRAAEGNDASYGDYVVNIYNEQSGLPTGEANVVIQTMDGYVWIGSYGGLIRYDGTLFKNFSEEKDGISSSSVRSLFEDSKGRLWIGTNDAGVFVYEKEQFTKIEGPKDRSFLCIRDFAEGADGVIYAASNSGLAQIEEGTLIPFQDEKVINNTVYALGVDNLDRVWCCLSWGCVVVKQDQVVGELPSETLFEGNDLYCLTSGKQGEIYLGTSGTEMARLVCLNEGFNKDSFEIKYYDTGDVTTHNQIRVCEDGSILVSGLKGFGWFRSDGSFYEFGEDKKASSVNAAALDYEGNIWLASTTLGVVKYSKGCFETPNDRADLTGKALNVILGQGGRYYVGTDNGLMVYDKNWNPVHNDLTELLAEDRIRHLMASKDGKVWIASYYQNGVISYDPATEEMVSYNTEEGLINSGIRMLLELSDGSIAVATQGGISIIKDGKVVKSYGREEGLTNTTILCMIEDEEGRLLAGSDGGGIYVISGTEIKNYGFDNGLNEGVVLRMLPNEDGGGCFISAGSSLYYWEGETFRKLENFEKSSGSIFDFYEKDGSLWMMQNNGILKVDKQALLAGEEAETRLYGFSFGLTGSLNANTWNYLDEDGTIYLSTRSGISTFRFTSLQNPLPKGIINEIVVDDVVYSHPESVTLNQNAQRITIDFSMLSYTGTTVSGMSYRLQGFAEEETVIQNEKRSSISYTNLPGGDYVFHLKIFHSEDEEVHEYQIPIHKEKQLTEYPLFWIILIVVILAVLASLVYLYAHAKMMRIKKKQEEYRDITNQFLRAFAKLIDAKDKYTNGHSIRVAHYSRELAKRLQMSEDEQEKVYYIALMHDIGKIGIPDSILKKEGRLTDEEMEVIRTHPKIGGEILKDCTAFPGIAEGASYHHERYDGKGYCMKLKGEEIPFVARIIGVADAYDAMSNARCYRKALDKEIIIHELKEGAGTQFDAKIVPIMLQMIEEGSVPVDLQDTKIEF